MNLLFTPTASNTSLHKEFTLENEEKLLSKTLTNFSITLVKSLRNFQNSSHELTSFKNEMKCILFHSRDENEIFTFDKTHKIKVILPKDKLIHKILNNDFYLKETQFHKHIVNLHKPSFDIKIGFDSISNNFYANLVLVVEDYTTHEKYSNKENMKKLTRNELVEKDEELVKTFSKIFEDFDMHEILFEKLSQSNYYGFNDIFDFFNSNEFLLLSNKIFPKLKKNFPSSEIILSFKNLKNGNNSPYIDLRHIQNEFDQGSIMSPRNDTKYKIEDNKKIYKENIMIKKVQNVKNFSGIDNNNINNNQNKISNDNITIRKIYNNEFNRVGNKFTYEANPPISISQDEKIKTKEKIDREIEDLLK